MIRQSSKPSSFARARSADFGLGSQLPLSANTLPNLLNASEDAFGHLINPVLHFPSDEEVDGDEGCLSLPGLTFDCARKAHVVAHGQNVYGDPVTIEGTQLLARCVQHEADHLDGVLFIDRLDALTKRAAMDAIRDAEWSGQRAPVVKASPHPLLGGAR